MKNILTILILFCTIPSFSQKAGDSRITVIVNDTTNLYQKVKYSLVNNNFIVKDNGNRDTLTTYVAEYKGIYCLSQVIIKNDTVQITGMYGLKRIDDFGYTQSPKSYKKITCYPGGKGKGWELLTQVAERLGDRFIYDK